MLSTAASDSQSDLHVICHQIVTSPAYKIHFDGKKIFSSAIIGICDFDAVLPQIITLPVEEVAGKAVALTFASDRRVLFPMLEIASPSASLD